ncbi:unnamed protein product [Phyllotreta striolata]|uniref:Uncharacterized protein n=1 Tax=Phyllotreta striolata TaxID=444603 RepID=A0A9N9XPX9_PHYSR|nr:unnamed protein product [Phyllotreta striolata]
MASLEQKLCVLQSKLKETDDNLSVCIVLLQQYLRQERYKKTDMKSIGIQVNVETKNMTTDTDNQVKEEEDPYQKSLTQIFGQLKTDLINLHSHIQTQSLQF